MNYKWIYFLSGNNTLLIENETDFNKFKNFLDYLGMSKCLKGRFTFSEWKDLASLNNYPTDYFIFEYVNHKSLAFGSTKARAMEWYDKEPYKIDEFEIMSQVQNKNKYKEKER